MDPGVLNYRITLQSKRVDSRDALGAEVTHWILEFDTWAAATQLSGRELVAAQAKHAESTWQFRIRYRRQVVPEWRVLWRGGAYNILSVTNVDGRFREMLLDCSIGLREDG